jgi:ABC-2 type transport system ATP-binding protein
MTPLFDLHDVTHFYGRTRALFGVSMSVPHGAIGLVGQNGAGKSTIIQIMLGMIRPTSGEATVMGYSVPKQAIELRGRVGYMPERDAIVTGMSGLEYVALAGELSGMPRREALRRAHESLSYLDLEDARYRNVETYSLGMGQRLKLAASLVHDPDVLLLDEPTAGLDPEGRKSMLDLLKGFASRPGKSILLSTHLLTDIERICDRAVILDSGEVRGVGTLDQLRTKGTQQYRVSWEGDASSLKSLLDDKSVALQEDANGAFVKLTDSFSTIDLFAAASNHNVIITQLEPEEETLDSVYHRLISENL